MNNVDTRLADEMLVAMMQAYPLPVDLSNMPALLGIPVESIDSVSHELVQNGLIQADLSDVPWARLRLTDKGMAIAAGVVKGSEDPGQALNRLELNTLRHLLRHRSGACGTGSA